MYENISTEASGGSKSPSLCLMLLCLEREFSGGRCPGAGCTRTGVPLEGAGGGCRVVVAGGWSWLGGGGLVTLGAEA